MAKHGPLAPFSSCFGRRGASSHTPETHHSSELDSGGATVEHKTVSWDREDSDTRAEQLCLAKKPACAALELHASSSINGQTFASPNELKQ